MMRLMIVLMKKSLMMIQKKISNDSYVTNEEIIDDDTEETVYIKMLNKMITKVNEFKLAEFTYASCFDEVNEILVKRR